MNARHPKDDHARLVDRFRRTVGQRRFAAVGAPADDAPDDDGPADRATTDDPSSDATESSSPRRRGCPSLR